MTLCRHVNLTDREQRAPTTKSGASSAKKNGSAAFFLLTVLVAALFLPVLTGCLRRSPIVGTWRLVSSQEEGYPAGMLFEFRQDGTLVLEAGNAPFPSEEMPLLTDPEKGTKLIYTTSLDGGLKLTLLRENKNVSTFSMKYTLDGDRLTIEDGDKVNLIFQRCD